MHLCSLRNGIGCFEIRIAHPGGNPHASHCLVVLLCVVQLQTLAGAFAGAVMAAVLDGRRTCIGPAQPTQYALLVLARIRCGRALRFCLRVLHECNDMCREATR